MTRLSPLIALGLMTGCGGLSAPGTLPECDPATDPTCSPVTTPTGGTGTGTGNPTGTGTGTGTGSTTADPEICDDGTDNDGDGATDCEDPDCGSDPACDADGDGYADELLGGDDCDDSRPGVNPGAVEACDTLDNDCDGAIDEDDDGDGFDACADCNDLDNTVYPGAYDPCNDGVDANCDGSDACADWTEDFEGGNLGNLVGGGTLVMVASTTDSHTGSYAAQGGAITHSQTTCMSVVLNYAASGEIRFWARTDSEPNYDYLRFRIDGVEQDQWSGIVGWAEYTYPVGSGSHTMQWCYEKDGSVNANSDTAWVDDIVSLGGIP